MAKGRKTYPREYRERLVELYRAGRSAESLAKDFEPTAQSIRNWVRQADLPLVGEELVLPQRVQRLALVELDVDPPSNVGAPCSLVPHRPASTFYGSAPTRQKLGNLRRYVKSRACLGYTRDAANVGPR